MSKPLVTIIPPIQQVMSDETLIENGVPSDIVASATIYDKCILSLSIYNVNDEVAPNGISYTHPPSGGLQFVSSKANLYYDIILTPLSVPMDIVASTPTISFNNQVISTATWDIANERYTFTDFTNEHPLLQYPSLILSIPTASNITFTGIVVNLSVWGQYVDKWVNCPSTSLICNFYQQLVESVEPEPA